MPNVGIISLVLPPKRTLRCMEFFSLFFQESPLSVSPCNRADKERSILKWANKTPLRVRVRGKKASFSWPSRLVEDLRVSDCQTPSHDALFSLELPDLQWIHAKYAYVLGLRPNAFVCASREIGSVTHFVRTIAWTLIKVGGGNRIKAQ